MKRIEEIYREILYQALEGKNSAFTQKSISVKLDVSISTVNHALQILKKMNAIRVNPRNFKIVNTKKILYYWACIRNVKKEVLYKTRFDGSVSDIEKNMPNDIIFAAYSAYKFKFRDMPSDYSSVYVYSDDIKGLKGRFPEKNSIPNIFALKSDKNIKKYGKTTSLGNIFVDLWNIDDWYAAEFLSALEKRIK
jgi:predicted transcriptional regulator